jgi:hypothetical protein
MLGRGLIMPFQPGDYTPAQFRTRTAARSESNEIIARKNVKEDLNDKDSCLLSYV